MKYWTYAILRHPNVAREFIHAVINGCPLDWQARGWDSPLNDCYVHVKREVFESEIALALAT